MWCFIVGTVSSLGQHFESQRVAEMGETSAGMHARIQGSPGIRLTPQCENGCRLYLLQVRFRSGTRGTTKDCQKDLLGADIVGRCQEYFEQFVVDMARVGVDARL